MFDHEIAGREVSLLAIAPIALKILHILFYYILEVPKVGSGRTTSASDNKGNASSTSTSNLIPTSRRSRNNTPAIRAI